jgi:phage tail sheath gpL-like
MQFNSIPSNLRVPIVTASSTARRHSRAIRFFAYRGLLIGQKLAAGSQAADTVVKCTNVNDAIAKAGRGSILHRKAIAWFASNKSTELWLGVLADDAGGVAATGTIVVTASGVKAGTIMLYLGGVLVTVGVADARRRTRSRRTSGLRSTRTPTCRSRRPSARTR